DISVFESKRCRTSSTFSRFTSKPIVPGNFRAKASATGKPTYPSPITAMRSCMGAENIAFSRPATRLPAILAIGVADAGLTRIARQIVRDGARVVGFLTVTGRRDPVDLTLLLQRIAPSGHGFFEQRGECA